MAKLDEILKTGNGRVLTLEDVKDNFDDYNFIITLNHDVIDTSIYESCVHKQAEIVGAAPSGAKWLVLSTIKNVGNVPLKPTETRIIIFDVNVVDIKVKSKRNFLLNQN